MDIWNIMSQNNLFEASRHGNIAAIRHLLKEKYQNDASDIKESDLGPARLTPLHGAAFGDHKECLLELLNHKMPLDEKDEHGRTFLHVAALSQALSVIEIVSELPETLKNDFINSVNLKRETALHALAWNGSVEGLQILLENGANPNALNQMDRSPLYNALTSKQFNVEVLQVLLHFGAKPEMPEHGFSLVELARSLGNQAVLTVEKALQTFPQYSPLTKKIAGLSDQAPAKTPLSELTLSNSNVDIEKQLANRRQHTLSEAPDFNKPGDFLPSSSEDDLPAPASSRSGRRILSSS